MTFYETARLSPTRRRALKHLALYSSASIRVELSAINTRVLARGVTNAIRRGEKILPMLPEAMGDLSKAVKSLWPLIWRNIQGLMRSGVMHSKPPKGQPRYSRRDIP